MFFSSRRATTSNGFTLTVDFPDIFLCLLSKQRSVSISKWVGATLIMPLIRKTLQQAYIASLSVSTYIYDSILHSNRHFLLHYGGQRSNIVLYVCISFSNSQRGKS